MAIGSGGLYVWGHNYFGQLGDGTLTSKLSPEAIDPGVLNNIVAVAAATDSSYALSSDGSICLPMLALGSGSLLRHRPSRSN